MKENPRDRNFWALLAQTDVPKETRYYVFRIFSAAVIGEDPKLFGFAFERPLPASGGLCVMDLVTRRLFALALQPLVETGEVPCQDREGALAALRAVATRTPTS